jgi:hypothetical protein
MRQVEISRTLVFDDPRRARSFFEALVADNVKPRSRTSHQVELA